MIEKLPDKRDPGGHFRVVRVVWTELRRVQDGLQRVIKPVRGIQDATSCAKLRGGVPVGVGLLGKRGQIREHPEKRVAA